MRARRILASVAAAIVVAGTGSTLVAPTASAAELSPNCAALNTLFRIQSTAVGPASGSGSISGLQFNAGEVITATVTALTGGPVSSNLRLDGTQFAAFTAAGQSGSRTVQFTGAHAISYSTSYGGAGSLQVMFTCGIPSADTPIPMWVQAFARASADAPCPDGWEKSWDQWPNGGKGGYVCQRSIKAFGN